MHILIEKIKELSPKQSEEAIPAITNMLCSCELQAPLSEKSLLQALSLEGEYLVLKMSYDEFSQELIDAKIKYKISQALSIVVCYEEDGSSFEDIKKFVDYISSLTDPKQNAIFGIKKVKNLSSAPITILFSGILPINQLKMHISRDIYELIHSDEEYFKTRFKEFREILSQEIGIPILPVFPMLDKSLEPSEAKLIDLVDGRIISHFWTAEEMNKITIEGYLVKLFYIYITLVNR